MRRAHGLVLASSSDLLKSWMEATSASNAASRFSILLPDAEPREVDALLDILYGLEVVVPGTEEIISLK